MYPDFSDCSFKDFEISSEVQKALETWKNLQQFKPSGCKANTNWFITVNPIEDIDAFRKKLAQKTKKKSVNRFAGCFEHTKKGVPHLHLIVEFVRPMSLSEVKRVFNFEKVMITPKYKIITFDSWDKMIPYLNKAPIASI